MTTVSYRFHPAVCLAALLLASCGGGPKVKIAVIPKETNSSYWRLVRQGAEQAAREAGDFKVDLVWNAPAQGGKIDGQVKFAQACLSKGFQGIVLAPLDDRAFIPVLEQAWKSKVPVAIIDSRVNATKFLTFVGTDQYRGGLMAGRELVRLLGGKGRVGLLDVSLPYPASRERRRGFSDALEEGGMLAALAESSPADTPKKCVENLCAGNMGGLFAVDEVSSTAALEFLEARGLSGKIHLVGFDFSDALLAGVRAGKVDALVIQNPFKMGYEGVRAVLSSLSEAEVGNFIDTGIHLVHAKNIDQPETRAFLNPALKTQPK